MMMPIKFLFGILCAVSSADAFYSPCPPFNFGRHNLVSHADIVNEINTLAYDIRGSHTGRHRATGLTAKKQAKENDTDGSEKPSIMDTIKKSPGTLIAAPFVVLIGVDLVLNIGVLVKRTVEYFAFGKIPSTEVWFSDNFFL